MSKPLNQFGGWLTFFFITTWIPFLLSVGFAFITLCAIFRPMPSSHLIDNAICLLTNIVSAYLYFLIIKTVRNQNSSIPDKIIKIMTWYFMLAVVFTVARGIASYFAYGYEGLKDVGELGDSLLKTLIWYGIWIRYFQESKRVREYYGKNADFKLAFKII